MSDYRYRYLGDRLTRSDLVGRLCNPIRLGPDGPISSPDPADGTCVVSVRMASAAVEFDTGERVVVARRRLRLAPEWKR